MEAVEAYLRAVLESGEPLTELEVAGATAAAPGVDREFIVSYWPVRRRDDHRVVGVGAVVFEVTERRAAERAAHEQTARYESLLLALSEVGGGDGRADGDGRLEYANPAFEAICGYSDRRAASAAVRLRPRRRGAALGRPQARTAAARGRQGPGVPAHGPATATGTGS